MTSTGRELMFGGRSILGADSCASFGENERLVEENAELVLGPLYLLMKIMARGTRSESNNASLVIEICRLHHVQTDS